MHHLTLPRVAGRFLLSFICAVAAIAAAQAQPAASPSADNHQAIRLDKYVVSASRTPQDPKLTPSSVTVLMPVDLAAAQVVDLRTALMQTPGVIVVSTGATGGQTSVFMRGANADQVLFFVDGVRMNTTDAGYANFLGGADLGGIDRIEVLRGPQSTLYGSSAMGGVIAIDTARGCGPFSGAVNATAGTFDTFGASVAVQGGTPSVGYSASLTQQETDNDRPDNTYKQTSYTSRVEFTPSQELLLGATLRGQLGSYDEAGSELFPGKGHLDVPNHLVTSYAQWSPSAELRSRVTAGWHQTEYDWKDKTYGPSSNFYTRNTRRILDWQNSWQPCTQAQLVAGVNAEWAHYTSGGQTLKDRQRGLYASGSVRPVQALSIDLGVRTDDHDLEGRADTWRSGVAYRIEETGTKLRATYGTGFKAPSMVNRFGSPPFYASSPTIKPEKSKGGDIGVDQEFLSGMYTVSATWFRNDFEDLINSVYTPSLFKYVATNVKEARTQGAEFALTARPCATLKLRAAYTYLSALDTSSSVKAIRLTRRPRHTGDLDAQWQATQLWLIGSGVHFVSDRLSSSSAVASVRQEDYTTARIYTSYAINADATVKLRIENALNEEYSEVPGYPALPRGVFVSVEWKF